jgi:hypothetical protein
LDRGLSQPSKGDPGRRRQRFRFRRLHDAVRPRAQGLRRVEGEGYAGITLYRADFKQPPGSAPLSRRGRRKLPPARAVPVYLQMRITPGPGGPGPTGADKANQEYPLPQQSHLKPPTMWSRRSYGYTGQSSADQGKILMSALLG